MSAACFVHDSTYTLMRQTCLTVCNSASRCCGEQRMLNVGSSSERSDNSVLC